MTCPKCDGWMEQRQAKSGTILRCVACGHAVRIVEGEPDASRWRCANCGSPVSSHRGFFGDNRTMNASSSNATIVFENGERVYPCRCGETHRGEWAAYTYWHHNCFHDEPLIRPQGMSGYLLCPLCGANFFIEGEDFFEEDEPIEKIEAIWNRPGEKGRTVPPAASQQGETPE